MNNAGAFTIGLIFGGAAGAGITYMALKRSVDARIEAEVEEYKRTHESRQKAFQGVTEASEDDFKDVEPLEKPSKTRTKTSLDEGTPEDVPVTDYHKISENYMKPKIDVPEGTDPAEAESPEDDAPIFEFISADEFNQIDADKVTYLIWDPDENILQDEYGELIENREYLVGDLLDSLLAAHGENGLTQPLESAVYIRNNQIDAVYEIETVAEPNSGLAND